MTHGEWQRGAAAAERGKTHPQVAVRSVPGGEGGFEEGELN